MSFRSHVARLFGIGFLVLLLQIPVWMIGELVGERQTRRDLAVAEVSSTWGGSQTIVGPALVLPHVHRWIEISEGKQTARTGIRNAIVLPDRLNMTGAVRSEIRQRGIFSIPVYSMTLAVDGVFNSGLRLAELGIDPAAVTWDRVRLAVNISDVRAIQEQTAVTWNGVAVAFVPGNGGLSDTGTNAGINAPVAIADAQAGQRFSFPLVLNGSVSTAFMPFAETTTVELRANSPHPHFYGGWLPAARTITNDGFVAKWNVPALGRSYPQAWIIGTQLPGDRGPRTMKDTIERSAFGVELTDPVDHYRMASRSVKYAALYLVLTFAVVWLMEVLSSQRVHPVQYLMLGAAMCVFYLLELSLSEHLGFGVAYAIAAVGVAVLISAYSFTMLGRSWPASVVGGGVSALYGYLYVTLTNEDYALLIGSIGLFVALALVMLVTRRVDWYAEPEPSHSR